ncbi:hypothetical protein [Aeoliella mucimassa]|uniref:Uncharacterized protein n=1 Tax=Aeoliella mucimassa TaxID=2527972 RepID=A0A518AM39_9BACT|nr:hypothetical protein [Aeoliella mucimassa]QDU55783.1 hypothetical protein Pan181_19790 [Aeoliella mucimassa]
MIATRTRLREIAKATTAPKVDEAAGMLYAAKLLGEHSKNGRRYPRRTREGAVGMYAGKKIYLDHAGVASGERSYDRWVGTITRAYNRADGIYGDVKLRKKSPHYESIIEAATDFSNQFGFSHVADGSTRFEDGIEVVESISDVFSVDIVTDPAHGGGLFESLCEMEGAAMNDPGTRTDPQSSADQEIIDEVVKLAKELEPTLVKLVTKVHETGDSVSLSDEIGQVQEIARMASEWLQQDTRNFDAKSVEREINLIVDGIAELLRNPLVDGAPESIGSMMSALVDALDGAAEARTIVTTESISRLTPAGLAEILTGRRERLPDAPNVCGLDADSSSYARW